MIARQWPEQIDTVDLGGEALAGSVRAARLALLEALDLAELA